MSINQITVEELYTTIENYGLIATIKKYFGIGAKIQLPFSESACKTSITELDLSVRSTNCLMRAGIQTVEQLIDAIQEDTLLRIRNLGNKSRTEIRVRIYEFGYEQLSEKCRNQFIESLIALNKHKLS